MSLENGKNSKNYTNISAPRVSVIIPAYNVGEYIEETLASVFAQTYKDFEAIVINDGSPDTEKLEKILEKYADKIVYLKQKNKGAAVARNTGIENSRGELVAFLDGDDVWLPEFLERQIKGLDARNLDMIYCDALLFGEHRGKSKTYMEKAPSNGAVTPESLINATCNVITSGTIIKKEKIAEAGFFNPKAIRTEDFELWFSLAKRGVNIGYQKDVLLKYRVRQTGLSGDSVKETERTVHSLEIITERNELSADEEKLRLRQKRFAEAHHELAKGKYHLARENYGEAARHFSEANRIDPTLKLRIVNIFLRLAPKTTLRLFRKFRAAEAVVLYISV